MTEKMDARQNPHAQAAREADDQAKQHDQARQQAEAKAKVEQKAREAAEKRADAEREAEAEMQAHQTLTEPDAPIGQRLSAIQTTLLAIVRDTAALALTEAKRAGINLALMLGTGLGLGLLAFTIWLLLMELLVLVLHHFGLGMLTSVFIVFLLCVAAAAGMFFYIKKLSRGLLFKATRDVLLGRQPPVAKEEK